MGVKMNIKTILSHGAEIPKRGTKTSAGMDLVIKGYRFFNEDKILSEPMWFDEEVPHDHSGTVPLKPGGRMLALTGIKMFLPSPLMSIFVHEMQVRPRSGNSLKLGLTVLNSPGTIDQDYQGDIGVILYNASNETIILNDGDKIAQLVISSVYIGEQFEVVTSFEESERGDGGFGSTDKK